MNKIPRSYRRASVRPILRSVASIATVACAVTLILGVATFVEQARPAGAQTAAGAARIEVPTGPGIPAGQALNSGGSATAFALLPPSGAACSGDSASGGYRIQSYIVPASVDPGTLTFDASGPAPAGQGADLRQPMYGAVDQAPFVDRSTAAETGLVLGFPPSGFSFVAFGDQGSSVVPPGTYNMGIACSRDGGTVLDKYWNIQVTFAADASDVPGGITWAVTAPPATTTTTTTIAATTTVAGATTTVAGATTTVAGATTTVAGATTTVAGATTTVAGATTTVAGATTTIASSSAGSGSSSSTGGSGTGGSPSGGGNSLPSTGSSPVALAVWAILLLVFGRMAMLLSRRPKVRQAAD